MIRVENLNKDFILHAQGGTKIPVLRGAMLTVKAGECVALTGSSGSGKSTLLRLLQGNYAPAGGVINVAGLDLATATPREVSALRRATLGYVSQFLRVVPRVPALDVVAEPLLNLGVDEAEARERAATLLARLNLPERLWGLSPTTFSGGEQQRVNIARGFVHPYPVLLLDEPTASLDPVNRAVVLQLIRDAKARGAALVGIFHDAPARAEIADREVDVTIFAPQAEPA
ncbi:phosphonate C-P lyase system protein PhnL [Puniceibacterium sediminis]|uniref:Alpha-D-ribose 1-methylphosphonate 5-triphosphate synthase subunit PhnL n=1 Tax=Puniceibacterium sediminis TaxID=1608407 RepID=A0A238V492_9RHOB|nr:phosphonate C-P lyase system protein PhnL [Puniceibacterium sediminis]SNR28403.1 alpha-D-ribose 1-methylphosphonate 5-triphosphate synthase subunit PhnL [Puniceibacterium sediminis]